MYAQTTARRAMSHFLLVFLNHVSKALRAEARQAILHFQFCFPLSYCIFQEHYEQKPDRKHLSEMDEAQLKDEVQKKGKKTSKASTVRDKVHDNVQEF